MGSEIAPDARLDCVLFQILLQNRFEACACSGDKVEKIGCGPIDGLIVHLPQIKDIYSKRTCADFKLHLPQNLGDALWFTKATLMRFLHIIDSRDALKKAIAIVDELSQLEETRQFHISLYMQGCEDKLTSGEADNFNSSNGASTLEAGNGISSSDDSKNELLRAMNLRITALREELVSTFNLVARATFSIREIRDLEKFCEHFGAGNLRKLLCKLLELIQENQAVDLLDNKSSGTRDNKNDDVSQTDGDMQILRTSYSVKPVVYGASPAKVAQVERQSSTESESSYSSEEDRPRAERSRTMVRAAIPRRSASPMRRVQIGRSGSHRAPALAIKSLNYFPARERTLALRDAAPNDCEAEEFEQTNKKTEYNVTRMSVQDAINLFESKQRDQTADIQTRRSLTVNSVNTTKLVLRRWSAGMGEPSAKCLTQNPPGLEDPVNVYSTEEDTANRTEDLKACIDPPPGDSESVEIAEGSEKLETSDISTPNQNEANIPVSQGEETRERLDQAEWNSRKDADLNQILMKLVESKPIKHHSTQPDSSKTGSSRPQPRGGFYNHYKERRDEKLRENAGKKAEKQAQLKAMQKILDKTKAEISSRNISNVGKKQSLNKTQKVTKNVPQGSNSKKESPQPAKKALPKASPLPATRKSWPSTPLPRAAGTSPVKTPTHVHSSGPTSLRQKPQPSASVSRPSQKIERAQQQQKDVKKTQVDAKKSLKSVDENKRQIVPRSAKVMKTKSLAASEDNAAAVPVKPGLRSKPAKKSSVVPLESKPSLCKASGVSPGNSPSVSKSKVPLQAEEPVSKCVDPTSFQADEVVASIPDPVSQPVDRIPIAHEVTNPDLEQETQVDMLANNVEEEASRETRAGGDETILRMATSEVEIQPLEELIISPSSWVENDQQDLPIPSSMNASQLASPANPAAVATSGARVRHSLSQMLLEESSEPDINEWGIAENPPSIAYQKDAPKGLKRLLKFARKSRGEANVAGWSSPCTSEGEDDGDECKGFMKSSSDNLLRKAALNAKKYGQQASSTEAVERNYSDPELPSALSTTSSSSALSSKKFPMGHVSATATTKASRSFFSLSAFRGNKATETRFR
ncbi:hypothetical protein Ancab_006136 [Ancistrocladus abbreviatus]